LTADGWYSGGPGRTVNLINDLIYTDAYVNPTNPTLEITTKYDIENLWDFGFIQVSTDAGAHWTSQSNAYTTMDHDPSALAAIVANLPGLTGQNPGYPGWLTMTFDLTAYAGQTVRVGFRYMTDSATLGQGWWIQSAKLSGAQLTLTTGKAPLEADFQLSVVRAYVQNGQVINYIVNDVTLADLTETGVKGANLVQPNYVILVASSITRMGVDDYQFQVKVLPSK
jgi:bacillopeptidase F (M6 metalloprotease family)